MQWRDLEPMEGLNTMDPETDITQLLLRKRDEIISMAEQRGARNIRIFGSIARNEARPDSDIDLLIDLDPDRSLLDVGGLAMDLSRLLDRPVDIVTEAGLRDRIRARVLREARAL
ncbi:nucleotidyltransferase family protein [Methanosphaerula palustris]|uniref:protein adenylyltransferase n=1 Tax=Methanosphaerula palustris (strain ATCC BAA-1556 / DSM 19958 / E1-9c) TaxID=521011 RepID=B8GK25_METPE|nr:nucleotidyltransferase family protein [Methanosphaerula palustris]ACL17096.1 DNA polymerase beta domain protein region [Methanosphaerula palustris E1-9c]